MKDRVAQARGLLIQQYKEAASFGGLIDSFTGEMAEIESENDKLLNLRGLDTAQGAQLDVLGKIIVLDRPFQDPDPDDVFTFENPQDIGGPFTNIPGTVPGGYWIGLNPTRNARFFDGVYRFILRAKIIFNTSDATIEDMHRYARFVFDRPVRIFNRVGAIDISVDRIVGRQERTILENTFPLAAGVRIGDLTYSTGDGPAFGFDGDSSNGGFGDEDDSEVGGAFVALVV
jgi:hypothetical protein